jgi:hypothetical protein
MTGFYVSIAVPVIAQIKDGKGTGIVRLCLTLVTC